MLTWRKVQARRLSLMMMAGLAAVLSCPVRAADKAVFSGSSDNAKPLLNSQKSQVIDGASVPDSKSLAPDVGPILPLDGDSSQPRNNLRSKQFIESIDRKKNWIFERTEDLNRTSLNEDSQNTEELSLDPSASKPRRAVERFLTRKDQASKPGANHSTNETSIDFGKLDDNRRLTSPFEPEKRNGDSGAFGMGLNRLVDQDRTWGLGSGIEDTLRGTPLVPNSILSPVVRADLTDRLDPAYTQKQRMDGFLQMLHRSQSSSPLSASVDPISALADTSQPSVQPVLPKGSAGIESGIRPDMLSPFPAANVVGRSPFAGGPGDSSIHPLGPSSLSPAVISIPEPRINPPQPAMLTIPQRKF